MKRAAGALFTEPWRAPYHHRSAAEHATPARATKGVMMALTAPMRSLQRLAREHAGAERLGVDAAELRGPSRSPR